MSHSHSPSGLTIGDARLEQVAENAYAYIQPDGSWWINNTGFLTARDGVIVLDACSTEARTRAFRATIERVSVQPVRTLLNTHHHGDHTFGNYLFPEATIVAHDRAREEMLNFGKPFSAPFWSDVEWGEVELALPFLTYTTEVAVYVNDQRCELRHVGTPAHTTNDSILWLPEQRLLYSGDLLFNGGTPFLLMGSIAGALEAVENLKTLGAQTIVPGHGPVCGPEVIDAVLGYLQFLDATARSAHAADVPPLQAARDTDLGQYADLLDSERIVGNLHRAYAELDGTPRGGRIDVRAALDDMVTYNGGKPLTCSA